MKRIISILCLLLMGGGMLLSINEVEAKPKSNKGQIRKIKLRMQREMQKGKPSDSEVESLMQELNADGSFSGIDYWNEAFNSGGKKTPHLTKIAKLAKAYVTSPGIYFQNEEVYDAITKGLNWWVDKNLEDKNWWHRIIGYPKTLMISLVLMSDDMKSYDKEIYQKCIDYLKYSWSIPKQRAQEGANGTDICQFTFAAAVLSEDEVLLKEVMDKVNSLIKIARAPKEEGIQEDFSYTQHNGSGRQLYLATYGREYVSGILYFMRYTQGTPFWLAPEKVDIFEKLFLEGLQWTWYKGEIDVNQYGRGLLRKSSAPSYIAATEDMASFSTPREEELKEMISVLKGNKKLIGNKMFPRTDYMIHRTEEAMMTTRMTSTRTVGNEAGNNEGMQNYHTGDGANYIKVHGDEYNPIFAGWNWKRIPGTTIVSDDQKMPAPMWGAKGQGGNDYAGGVSDGKYGAAAFIYEKDGLKAHKSWFYFDKFFVALGSGITTQREDAPVITTINQTLHQGKVVTQSETLKGQSKGTFTKLWHYDTGYALEEGQSADAEIWKGNYSSKNKGKQEEILLLTLNHGIQPQNGQYAYAVYPAWDEKSFFDVEKDYQILSNTSKIQAVEQKSSPLMMVAFYEAGTLDGTKWGTLSVNQPCLLLLNEENGQLKIHVASPFAESRVMESVDISIKGKNISCKILPLGNSVVVE